MGEAPRCSGRSGQGRRSQGEADEAAKKDAVLLGKYQDKAVTNYRKNKGIRGPAPKK